MLKKLFVKNVNCQENTSAGVPFLIGIARSFRLFIKKRFWDRCFPENIEKHPYYKTTAKASNK